MIIRRHMASGLAETKGERLRWRPSIVPLDNRLKPLGGGERGIVALPAPRICEIEYR